MYCIGRQQLIVLNGGFAGVRVAGVNLRFEDAPFPLRFPLLLQEMKCVVVKASECMKASMRPTNHATFRLETSILANLGFGRNLGSIR